MIPRFAGLTTLKVSKRVERGVMNESYKNRFDLRGKTAIVTGAAESSAVIFVVVWPKAVPTLCWLIYT